MERELLITVKKSSYDNTKINREIECLKALFPYLESFETFTVSNQVFDLEKHTVVTTKPRLRHIFKEGVQKNNSFIVSLNYASQQTAVFSLKEVICCELLPEQVRVKFSFQASR